MVDISILLFSWFALLLLGENIFFYLSDDISIPECMASSGRITSQ